MEVRNTFSEKRDLARQMFYVSDGIDATIVVNRKKLSATCIDINPLGGRFAVEKEIYEDGSDIDIHFKSNGKKEFCVKGTIVYGKKVKLASKETYSVGVKFVNSASEEQDDKRRVMRYRSIKTFVQMAWCRHPLLSSERKICFNIVENSKDGLLLQTSCRNKFLVPNMQLKLVVSYQGFHTHMIKVIITHVSLSPDKLSFMVGVRIAKASPQFTEDMALFLLLSSKEADVKTLMKSGFVFSDLSKITTFQYESSQNDLKEILKLRLHAHQVRGRFLDSTDPQVMADKYDKTSRHIKAIVAGKCVGACRLNFINQERERSELNKSHPLPDEWFERKCIEFSKLVIHPDFQGHSFFLALLQESLRICIATGHDYIILSARDELVPIYKRFGMQEMNLTYEKTVGDETYRLNIMYLDIGEVVLKRKGNIVLWNELALPVLTNLVKRRTLSESLPVRWIVKSGKVLHPLTSFIFKRSLRLKSKRRAKAKKK